MTDRQLALVFGASIGLIVVGFWAAAELDRWLWNRRRLSRRGGWLL